MKITENLPTMLPTIRKVSLILVAISGIALAIFYLYRTLFSSQSKISAPISCNPRTYSKDPSVEIPHIDFIKKNQEALKTNSFFIKLLFCGTPERQKVAAEKMAQGLDMPFHYFDGREDNHNKLHSVLKSISLSDNRKGYVFVSNADQLNRPQLETILGHTGSVSKQLLLCLGSSSQDQLDPALISRYRFIVET